MSTIEIRKVTKKFGNFTAVKDADLSVAAGEVVCLLGPSGCGKTTTLRMIAGLERATAGDVIIAGKRMNDLAPEQRDIAMVFQFYALYPALTVRQNIAMPLHYERLGAAETEARVKRVADILHLTEVLDRLPAQVSEGEKQRIAVARAIVRDPNCFLFDEPLSRLDVELRHSMRGQIKAVLSNLSKATVIVTHDQLEALTMADRIAIMRDGLIEQVGSPHDVFARPANVFVASFIGTPQMNLIQVQFKGYNGGKARVAFDEQDVDIAVNPAAAGLQPGKVTLGVRPRAFTVVPRDTLDTIEAVAELIEPMGAETLIHARTKTGSDIRVVVPRDKRVKTGESLHLVPDPAQTHVFAEDGRAVRALSDNAPNLEPSGGGMSPAAAAKLEYAIIGVGVLALLMIFQPFNIKLFAIGCILVVLAGLINNLLPLAQPGVPARTVVKVTMIVAMIFCITLLVAIYAAYLYGVFFLAPPDPNTSAGKIQLAAKPWYMHSFTWTIAVIACVLAGLIAVQGKRRKP